MHFYAATKATNALNESRKNAINNKNVLKIEKTKKTLPNKTWAKKLIYAQFLIVIVRVSILRRKIQHDYGYALPCKNGFVNILLPCFLPNKKH